MILWKDLMSIAAHHPAKYQSNDTVNLSQAEEPSRNANGPRDAKPNQAQMKPQMQDFCASQNLSLETH